MALVYLLFAISFIWTASLLYRRFRQGALSDIPGPKSQSIFTGNSPDLLLPDSGVIEQEWQERYGHVVRYKAAFGEDRLWISDPKALQHILQTSGYNYKKPDNVRVLINLTIDSGIVWAEGDVHKRHRKVMLPAFGMPESKSFMPDFRNAIEKTVDKWNDMIVTGSSGKPMIIDIPSWLARCTLDAIGTAAFDYDFGALDDSNNTLNESFNNLFVTAFRAPSPFQMFWDNLASQMPTTFLYFIYEILPGTGYRRLRASRDDVRKVAKKLYEEKRTDLREQGGRDVMSLLVKANASENEKTRLRDDEIIPQMRTIMFAGHETTAKSTTWALYELAKHPEIQARVRAEILETRAKAQSRGDTDITIGDFENMPYTIAVMKEIFRLYSIVGMIIREAVKDDIVPLYTPLTTASGKVVTEIAIPKGTVVLPAIHGYHLNKDVWGPDAHEFNPERWFSPKNKDIPPIGVYGNLLTFSAGIRGCIGWRFAVIEIQTFLITLLTNFEFSVPDGVKIRKVNAGLMTPMLEGENETCSQLPLKITPITTSSS